MEGFQLRLFRASVEGSLRIPSKFFSSVVDNSQSLRPTLTMQEFPQGSLLHRTRGPASGGQSTTPVLRLGEPSLFLLTLSLSPGHDEESAQVLHDVSFRMDCYAKARAITLLETSPSPYLELPSSSPRGY